MRREVHSVDHWQQLQWQTCTSRAAMPELQCQSCLPTLHVWFAALGLELLAMVYETVTCFWYVVQVERRHLGKIAEPTCGIPVTMSM